MRSVGKRYKTMPFAPAKNSIVALNRWMSSSAKSSKPAPSKRRWWKSERSNWNQIGNRNLLPPFPLKHLQHRWPTSVLLRRNVLQRSHLRRIRLRVLPGLWNPISFGILIVCLRRMNYLGEKRTMRPHAKTWITNSAMRDRQNQLEFTASFRPAASAF
jgi:hypothetical protein